MTSLAMTTTSPGLVVFKHITEMWRKQHDPEVEELKRGMVRPDLLDGVALISGRDVDEAVYKLCA